MLVRMYVYPGMKLTDEQKAELDALDNLADEDIDLSDIPEITDEEAKRMWRANPRTDEEWEQYFRYNPKADPELKKQFEAKKSVG